MSRVAITIAALIGLWTSAAWGQPQPPLVFAAASLTDALTAVGEAYAQSGKTKPDFSYAASSALARQIENGAPAAIFVSADEQWMDYLAARDLITPQSRITLLGNRIALIAPKDELLNIAIKPGFDLSGALGTGKLALGDPDAVPVGRYAKAALENLGVWASVEPHVVRTENVRAVLAFVERGEVKAGVVYTTDAATTQNVRVVDTFPEETHPAITYPGALIGPAPTDAAKQFFAFLTAEPAKEIFRRYGFAVK